MRATAETLDDLLSHLTITYDAIAKAAGISRRTLYLARLGYYPRRTTIAKLAKFLGVDTARLRAAITASRAGK